MSETALTPLMSEIDRPASLPASGYANTSSYKPVMPTTQAVQTAPTTRKSDLNPAFVPNEFIQLQDQLEKEGSSTSTLSTILAWGAAIKGQPGALLAIEDAKRRTALGKAAMPYVRRFNELANDGKFEEANQYLDTIATNFGARASELVPYFQQMQSKLAKRQEGYATLTAIVEKREAEGQDDPSNVN